MISSIELEDRTIGIGQGEAFRFIVSQVFPDASIHNIRYTSGTVNQDIELDLLFPSQRVYLRFYSGDDAGMRCINEDAAYGLIRKYAEVPVPDTLLLDLEGFDGKPVVLQTCLPGLTLKHVLNIVPEEQQSQLLPQVGFYIGKIHSVSLERHGSLIFCDQQHASWNDFLSKRMQHDLEICAHYQLFTNEFDRRVRRLVERQKFFSDIQPELVHGDLHPDNILVTQQENGIWEFSGIIDFEYAFGGDSMYDFAKLEWSLFDRNPRLKNPFFEGYSQTHTTIPHFHTETHAINCIAEIIHFLPFGAAREMHGPVMYNIERLSKLILMYGT